MYFTASLPSRRFSSFHKLIYARKEAWLFRMLSGRLTPGFYASLKTGRDETVGLLNTLEICI